MKNSIIAGTVFFTMIIVPGAYAVTESDTSSTATPTATPTAHPVATSSPTSQPTSTPVPTPSYAPGMAPGEHAGWAIVNPETGQVSGGVIVCTPEVCGSGWFAGMRVVLQTLQDPVEAAGAPNGVGNVAGYSGGTYNFQTGKWTMGGPGGAVYEIPLAYPGADRGGNVNIPFCVENCPTPEPEPTPEPTPTDEPSPEPSPSASEGSMVPADENTNIVVQERRISVKPSIINNNVVINKKLNDKVFRNQVLIIATKGNKKKVWTQQVSGKIVSIKIPRKYLFWNISIRYVVG